MHTVASEAGCGRLRLGGQRSWQPEVDEEAALTEPCDGGDAVRSEGEDHQSVRPRYGRVRVGEVAAKGGLAVGPGGHEPQVCPAARCSVLQEPGDRLATLVRVRLRRHGEPGVV